MSDPSVPEPEMPGDAPDPEAAVDAFRRFALVTLACVAAVIGLRQLGLSAYATVAVAAALFVGATRGAEVMPGGLERAGMRLGGLLDSDGDDAGPLGIVGLVRTILRGVPSALREFGFASLVMGVVVPPFVLGYVAWFRLQGQLDVHVPMELAGLVLTQLVLVAVPEEAFFRGFLQTRLADAWPAERTVFGRPLPLRAIVAQAAAFALLHFIVEPRPDRLAVFFPALLFGWSREVRGGIGAAVFLHAGSNLFSEFLSLSMR